MIEATVTENRMGDLIVEIHGPYDVETYIQGQHDVEQALRYIRPCQEDEAAGYDVEDVLSSTGTPCRVDEHWAWTRFKHEQALEFVRS